MLSGQNVMGMLKPGDKAPEFEGTVQDGTTIQLGDYAGKKLALYFYPRDFTPGCTTQACNLQINLEELANAGYSIVGVSPDSVRTHERFARKFNLSFLLIADTEKVICNAYGVWGEKNSFGRMIWGVKRTTFLIDEDGRIVKVIGRPKLAAHAQEIIGAVD